MDLYTTVAQAIILGVHTLLCVIADFLATFGSLVSVLAGLTGGGLAVYMVYLFSNAQMWPTGTGQRIAMKATAACALLWTAVAVTALLFHSRLEAVPNTFCLRQVVDEWWAPTLTTLTVSAILGTVYTGFYYVRGKAQASTQLTA
jgi:hypothetical protein